MLDPLLPPREGCEAAPQKEAGRPSPAADKIFASLLQAKAAVLAVSGGPDSVALMLMAADWAKTGAAPPLFVATVDHGLRPESRHEAEKVGLWAAALGLPHRILTWEGEKPKTRIQERAREARYGLLCTYAEEAGAGHLVTAHHADDQAETILFRLLRGSGLKGLAGMSAAKRRGDIMHLRPLLGWSKADLVALCHAREHAFFDDPSNRNPAYARARLRRLSGVLSENGLDKAALLRLGARLARADAALQGRAAALAENLQNLAAPPAAFKADISSLRGESEEILGRVLEIIIRRLRGDTAPLRLDRLESVAAHVDAALTESACFSGTLGGVTLNLDQKSYLTIKPEGPRQRGRRTSA